jgi:hypothetical protein
LEHILKKLLLAGLLSLGVIALSSTQAQAGETLCIKDSEYIASYGWSDFCQSETGGYYLFSEHSDETSLVLANSPDGETLRISVSEVGTYDRYSMQIGPDGDVQFQGNRSIFEQYHADVMTMFQALRDASGLSDLPGE